MSFFTNNQLIFIEKEIHYPLSEKNIIMLQNEFLCKGMHTYKIKNVEYGRDIITSLLNSLKCFNNIACLTNEDINDLKLDNSMSNIFKFFNTSDICKEDEINEFFINHFSFDFLWIEITHIMLSFSWFNLFNKYLIDFNLHKIIPIISFSYSHY